MGINSADPEQTETTTALPQPEPTPEDLIRQAFDILAQLADLVRHDVTAWSAVLDTQAKLDTVRHRLHVLANPGPAGRKKRDATRKEPGKVQASGISALLRKANFNVQYREGGGGGMKCRQVGNDVSVVITFDNQEPVTDMMEEVVDVLTSRGYAISIYNPRPEFASLTVSRAQPTAESAS